MSNILGLWWLYKKRSCCVGVEEVLVQTAIVVVEEMKSDAQTVIIQIILSTVWWPQLQFSHQTGITV